MGRCLCELHQARMQQALRESQRRLDIVRQRVEKVGASLEWMEEEVLDASEAQAGADEDVPDPTPA